MNNSKLPDRARDVTSIPLLHLPCEFAEALTGWPDARTTYLQLQPPLRGGEVIHDWAFDGGLAWETQLAIEAARQDSKITFTSRSLCLHDGVGAVLAFWGTETSGGPDSRIDVFAYTTDGKVVVTFRDSGGHATKDFVCPAAEFGDMDFRFGRRLAPGKRYDRQIIDTDTRGLKHISWEITQTEGGYRATFRSEEFAGEMHCDPAGLPLTVTGAGVVFRRVDAETYAAGPSAEGALISQHSPLDCWIVNGDALERLEVRVRASTAIEDLVQANRRQRLHSDADDPNTAKVVLIPERPCLDAKGQPEELARYLQPERGLQSDAPEIRALAGRLTAGVKSRCDASLKITKWVSENINSTYDVADAGALETLKDRRGDCTENAALFVALARAAEIPARTAGGWQLQGTQAEDTPVQIQSDEPRTPAETVNP